MNDHRDNNNSYQSLRNDVLLFSILFLIIEGFRTGRLTWKQLIIGLFAMIIVGHLIGVIGGFETIGGVDIQ